jgi:hypothetical protein
MGTRLIATICAAASISAAHARDATLYLAPGGNDRADGLSPQTALATPARAVERLRELRATDQGLITILFADGVYTLEQPLSLIAGDGPAALRVAREDGDVLLSGGRALSSGWTSRPFPTGGRLFALTVDPLPDGRMFRDLYYKNTRCLRARFPNPTFERAKYTTITEVLDAQQDRFRIVMPPPGVGPGSPLGMEIVAVRSWAMPRQLVDTHASRDTSIVCSGPLGATSGIEALRSGDHVYLENWPAFIDVPFEWSLTRQAPQSRGDLRLLMPAGSQPGNDMVAPMLDRLLVLEGCSGITLDGLDFAFTDQPFPTLGPERPGYDPGQAGQDRVRGGSALRGAVELRLASACVIRRCRIAHTGGNGLMIDGPGNRVEQCEVFDTGGSAVAFGPFGRADRHSPPSSGCSLRDCAIHNFGAVYADTVGVWAADAPGLILEHNHISQGGYSGISAGWIWGHEYTSPAGECPEYRIPRIMEHTVIRNNDISRVMRELTDGGGIYVLGSQGGPNGPAVMEGNWVHDIERNPAWSTGACNGLYFDQGSDGWLVTSNLVERTARLIHFNCLSPDGLAPNTCSGCSGPCKGQPYGHATWHSAFRSDNGHLWPGQQWDAGHPNYFDRDPTRIPANGWGTVDLPAFVNLKEHRSAQEVEAIRQGAGPRSNWVFERDPVVHPYRENRRAGSPR